jgi:hypothetical protein
LIGNGFLPVGITHARSLDEVTAYYDRIRRRNDRRFAEIAVAIGKQRCNQRAVVDGFIRRSVQIG